MGERYQAVFGDRRVQASPRGGHWRRAMVAGAAAGALAVLALATARHAEAPRPVPVSSESHGFLDFDPSHDAAVQAVMSARADVAATAPAIQADGRAAVCGIGRAAMDADDPDGAGQIPSAQRIDAARRLDAALAAAPDPRARAAGRLLRLSALRDDGTESAADAATQTLAELAGEAAQSTDAAVYAAALAACAHSPDLVAAACGALNANRWRSLESDNAAPWLRLAQEARDAGDDAALANAVYQASIARRVDWHDDELALAALQALPADASPLARTLDAHAIAQARDDWARPAYGGLVAFCTPDLDANRKQVCEASAAMLLRPQARAADLRVGARLGYSLGWPADKLEALRLQRDALAMADDGAPALQAWDCGAADRLRQQAELRVRLGETGARRALLAAAGHDIDGDIAHLRRLRASRVARLETTGDATP